MHIIYSQVIYNTSYLFCDNTNISLLYLNDFVTTVRLLIYNIKILIDLDNSSSRI